MKLRGVSIMIVTTPPAESANCRGDCCTAPRPAILSNLTVVAVVVEASEPSQLHSNSDGCDNGSGCQWQWSELIQFYLKQGNEMKYPNIRPSNVHIHGTRRCVTMKCDEMFYIYHWTSSYDVYESLLDHCHCDSTLQPLPPQLPAIYIPSWWHFDVNPCLSMCRINPWSICWRGRERNPERDLMRNAILSLPPSNDDSTPRYLIFQQRSLSDYERNQCNHIAEFRTLNFTTIYLTCP
jgi:hypothetical protein